ncbi:MAG: ATP-binding cassette domain-containing protein [Gammaproteobacteria bacterium]|nr:ATP-binding cassette domain-containing protein [Gammaproteobacteria bacterium]MYF30372.1 ATP-binding cassette domain-containing protein [Gammaproteobacteria bacterium]MYK46748.1 ATP-binding cassette domain-containing protein [Gammaproteobacteria bacterium]
MIEVEGLVKRFGKVEALRGVDFTAADGRITGLLGPNGAGKSTTLRILCGVLKAGAGSARVGGIEVRDDPMAVRRRIGVLPHNSNLYPNLTARENIAYYAALQGLAGPPLTCAVEVNVERLGIGPFADRRAKGFSQGQRLRVALARALVHDPDTLILDEPTNGLDVMATRVLREVIRERRDSGCCVLFSSHIMQEVAVLCDRIAIVAEGKVVVDGTADEIRAATGCDDLEDAFVEAVQVADSKRRAGDDRA